MNVSSYHRVQKSIACLLIVMGLAVCAPFASSVHAAEGRGENTVFRQAMKNASKEDRAKVKQIRDTTKTQIEQLRDSANAEIAKILGISVDDMPKKQKERD